MPDLTTVLTSALTAGIIVAAIQFISGWRDRAAADRRHLREQALKLAMEQWMQETKAANVRGGATVVSGVSGSVPNMSKSEYCGQPARDLHEIVFRALKFVDAFSKNEVTETNLHSFYSQPATGTREPATGD